ncbi:GNAT family N-acetyltransferase [Flavobacteriaceae bacterium S356]|uniref:GNAT family N-acetyltransferase n=1 Tax=Asprobacillus argus TaxID=3076534 RepID=A0ABU3LJT1_9FLAO|nr:GNAT family N-acetyltransferase [Flavobacteriaceae bacterium S356]
MTIRTATLKDIEELLIFEQGIIDAERPMDITLKREKTYYYDLPYMINEPSIELLVAEIQGELVSCGYARIVKARECFQYERFSYLGFMFTKNEYRGKGINKKIMESLYDWTRSQGVHEVRLEVYPNNPAAIKAYEKAGMKECLVTMRVDLREKM